MSGEGRRRLREAERGRLGAIIGMLLFAAALLWRGLRGGDLAWTIPFAVGLALVILAGVRLAHRRTLARLAPGQRWAGSVYVDVPAWRECRRLADTAPRGGALSAMLLAQDLAPGLLTIEADGLSWRPGRLSRWSGAEPWRLPRSEVAGVETAPVPGVARLGGGRALLVWLANGEALPMRAASPKGLVPALEQLGLGEAPVPGANSAAFSCSVTPPEVYVAVDPDVDLEGEELRAAAARLVDGRAAVDPLVAERRSEWIDHVATFWQSARDQQALMAYTMVDHAGGEPVRASLMVAEDLGGHPDDLDVEIRCVVAAFSVVEEGDATEPDVTVVELPAGPAVRLRKLARIDPAEHGSPLIDIVLYWVPVPGQPACLLLSFSTPDLPLADMLAETADDVAHTVRFTP